jgi:hypothetical protein
VALQLRAYGAQRCDVYAAHQSVLRQRLQAFVERRLTYTLEREYRIEAEQKQQMVQGETQAQAEKTVVVNLEQRESEERRHSGSQRGRDTATATKGLPGVGDGADSDEEGKNREALEGSIFAYPSAPSLRRGAQEANEGGGRSANRSLHRRGRTAGKLPTSHMMHRETTNSQPWPGPAHTGNSTALPPISASPEPAAPVVPGTPVPITTRMGSAFSDLPLPDTLSDRPPIASPLRSPFSSMSRLQLDQSTSTGATGRFSLQAAPKTASLALAESAASPHISFQGGPPTRPANRYPAQPPHSPVCMAQIRILRGNSPPQPHMGRAGRGGRPPWATIPRACSTPATASRRHRRCRT